MVFAEQMRLPFGLAVVGEGFEQAGGGLEASVILVTSCNCTAFCGYWGHCAYRGLVLDELEMAALNQIHPVQSSLDDSYLRPHVFPMHTTTTVTNVLSKGKKNTSFSNAPFAESRSPARRQNRHYYHFSGSDFVTLQ